MLDGATAVDLSFLCNKMLHQALQESELGDVA